MSADTCYQYATTSCKLAPDNCPTGYYEYDMNTCKICRKKLNGNIVCDIPGGRKRLCRRNCSTNDSCCTTGKPPIGYQCNPNYLNLGSVCNNVMQNYCGLDKIFTDDRCKRWCTQNNATCTNHTQNLCNVKGILNNSIACRNWCAENPGKCEVSSMDYCSKEANKNSQFCSCINSPLKNRK